MTVTRQPRPESRNGRQWEVTNRKLLYRVRWDAPVSGLPPEWHVHVRVRGARMNTDAASWRRVSGRSIVDRVREFENKQPTPWGEAS